MSDNLVALQKSQKQIRNPFGFNFTVTWDGNPIVFPGDGKWYTYVGRLADHITRHLKMAVLYRYHDEKKAELRDAGRDKEANKYTVPADVRNKVHMLITGQDDPELKGMGVAELEQQKLDLKVLEGEIKKVDTTARVASVQGQSVRNVAHILDQANEAAAIAGRTTKGSAVISESMSLEPQEEAMPTEAMAVSDEPQAQPEVVPEAAVVEAQDSEFPELDGLE